MRILLALVTGSIALLLSSCGGESVDSTPTAANDGASVSLEITSSAFSEGSAIPARYTCDGENLSPPLAWSGVPEGTKSLALIVDDPDAPRGTFTHWVIFNLPPSSSTLPERVARDETLPDGSRQGRNGANQTGYTGPCPPSGTHRYVFKLYALDTVLNSSAGVSKDDVLRAIEGHVLAETQLVGLYARQQR